MFDFEPDSLDKVELLLAMEEEFGCDFSDPDQIIGDLIDTAWRRDPQRDRAELSLEIRSTIAEILRMPLQGVTESMHLRDLFIP